MLLNKIRTIDDAYEELKKADPGSSITRSGLRRLVVTGRIPSMKLGAKYLLNLEDVERFFVVNAE